MRLILIFFTFYISLACTKKRDESFVQGQGKDLLSISEYDGKEFPVETKERIIDSKENPGLSKSENFTHNKNSELALMGAVKVETTADLLGDVPFIALPMRKTGYKIKYVINNDFLVVMKVADKKLIHPKELAGATDQGQNQWAIPLVGYPIRGLINAEYVNENGEKSNKLIESNVNDKKLAKYFKIDKNNRTIYKLQEKLDLFSKDYFVGENGNSEWYFAQTIIGTNAAQAENTGWVLAQQDNELNALSKVKFTFNKNELRASSVNVDSRVNTQDEINQTVLVKLPIEWKEFRPTPNGSNSYIMTEEENNSIDWEKRPYMKVDFAGASTISISNPRFRFVDLEVDTNYFSFTLFDPDNNLRIKHSFLRDANRKKYIPKKMLKKDFEKFGFFSTQKHEINNYEKYRQEDFGNNVFINRFNVANEKIEFYFTEGSDEKLIPAAAKAADEWSEAFSKAGVPLKIVAITDKSKRVRLGDLRYNQINLIRSANESNLFGYGPSITDPKTGEIISATTNMHITSIVSTIVAHIRDYLLFKSGQTKKLSLFVEPPALSEKINLKGEKVSFESLDSSNAGAQKLLKKFPVMGLNGQLQMKEIESKDSVHPKTTSVIKSKNWGREFDIGVTGKNLNKEIDDSCPELESLVQKYKKDAEAGLEMNLKAENENEIIIACAEKIVPKKMFGTLLHEMGHNFGLRHNFYGSVDALNFLSKEETKTDETVHSSSVMEYPSFGEDRLTKVGKYDIAALRYGYADSVETSEGIIVKLKDTNKSIEENVGSQKLKSFLFCTDEDVAIGTDPMCARHDAGTTPDEVAYHLINEYNSTISDYNYRMGRQRAVDPMRLTNHRLNRYWIPLKRIYDEWRFKLNDQLGIGNEYLENFDAKKLEDEIKSKTSLCQQATDPNSAECQLLHYKKAAERIFKFSMQMATLPPKYCLGQRNGSLASVEFADIRKLIMSINKFVPKNCQDPVVQKYVVEKYGFNPEMESGYELEDVRLDMKIKMSNKTDWYGNPIPEPPDIIGLMPEKMIAMEVLSARASLTMSSEEKSFRPNFLDEPVFRDTLLVYLSDRMTKGINSQLLLSGSQLKSQNTSPLFLEKFKYEKRYIDSMIFSLFYGLDIPDKSTATKNRKKKFLVKYTDKKEILDKAKYKVVGIDGTTYYSIMNDDATEAKKFVEMLVTLPKRLETASPLTEKTFEPLLELVESNFGNDETFDSTKLVEFLNEVINDEMDYNLLCENKIVVRSKENAENDKSRIHWKKIFAKELAVYRPYAQELIKPGYGTDGSASALMLCAKPEEKTLWYEQNGKLALNELKSKEPNYNLNKKIILDRIAEYKKVNEVKDNSKKSEDYFNYDELSTQLDMIMNMLRFIQD